MRRNALSQCPKPRRKKVQRIIADKAYDSDPLDTRLRRKGIHLAAPHKANRKKKPTQYGRELQRYRKQWKAERNFIQLGC